MSFRINRPVTPSVPSIQETPSSKNTVEASPPPPSETPTSPAVTPPTTDEVSVDIEVPIQPEFDPEAALVEAENKPLPPALEEQVDEAVAHNQQVFQNTSKLLNVKVSNPNGVLSDQHQYKADRLGKQSAGIAAREAKVETLIAELEAQGLTADPAYAELKEDLSLLKKTRAVVDATQAIHQELATHKDINRPNTPAQLQQLTHLNQQLKTATAALDSEFKGLLDQAGGDESFLPEGIQDVIAQGKQTGQRIDDIVALAQNTDVMASQRAIDRPVYVNGMLSQYDSYVELAENGAAYREGTPKKDWPHPDRGYVNRPEMTPDADGFVVFSRKGKEDSDVFAKRFDGLSQEVDDFFASGKNLSPEAIAKRKTELMAKIDKSFQTESGTYFVQQDRVDTVKKIYGDQFDVAHAEYLAENNQVVVDQLGPISDEMNRFFQQENLTPQMVAKKRAEIQKLALEKSNTFADTFGKGVTEQLKTNVLKEFDDKAALYSKNIPVVNVKSSDEALGQVLQSNKQADQLNDNIGLNQVTGFQGNAIRQLQNDNAENIQRADQVQHVLEDNLGDVSTLQTQQNENLDRTFTTMGSFLENAAPGTHLKVYVNGGVKFGAEAGDWLKAEVSATVGLSATIEKGSGQGPGYLFHADFDFTAEGELKLGEWFSAKAGYDYSKVLAGVAFRTPEDVQTYVGHFQDMLTAFGNEDREAFDKAVENIDAMSTLNSYNASSHTGRAEMEFKITDKISTKRKVSVTTETADYYIPEKLRTPELQAKGIDREYVKGTNTNFAYGVGPVTISVQNSKTQSYADPEHTQPISVDGSQSSNITGVKIALKGPSFEKAIQAGSVTALPAGVATAVMNSIREQNPDLVMSDEELGQTLDKLMTVAATDALLASRLSQANLAGESSGFLRFVFNGDKVALDVGFEADIKIGGSSKNPGFGVKGEAGLSMMYGRRFELN